MDEDFSRVEPKTEADDEEEFRLDEDGEPFPILGVWVNSGFGNRSYACAIQPNGMMTLPDGLVRELGIEVGDDLEWNIDEEEGVIYVKVIHRPWAPPDWLDVDDD
jgi:hypothetical protein